jgi:hypothetical protein
MKGKEKNEHENAGQRGFWDQGIVIFLIGPLVFLFVARFTGFQIFYHGQQRKKAIILLASGSAFYLAAVVFFWSIRK